MAHERIPYNKEIKTNKVSKYFSGPRDMQRRSLSRGQAEINMPSISMDSLKELIHHDEIKSEIKKEVESARAVDAAKSIEGIGLPFAVVEQKIREAVEETERITRERYESGLGSLNSQLNVAKKQLKESDALLGEKNREIENLKSQLRDKDLIILQLKDSQTGEISELRGQISEILTSIKSGNLVNEDKYEPKHVEKFDKYAEMNRPVLDEKIFIDPLSEVSTDLDSHINIDASAAAGYKRDLKEDVDKLKSLLEKNKYKPSSIKI